MLYIFLPHLLFCHSTNTDFFVRVFYREPFFCFLVVVTFFYHCHVLFYPYNCFNLSMNDYQRFCLLVYALILSHQNNNIIAGMDNHSHRAISLPRMPSTFRRSHSRCLRSCQRFQGGCSSRGRRPNINKMKAVPSFLCHLTTHDIHEETKLWILCQADPSTGYIFEYGFPHLSGYIFKCQSCVNYNVKGTRASCYVTINENSIEVLENDNHHFFCQPQILPNRRNHDDDDTDRE